MNMKYGEEITEKFQRETLGTLRKQLSEKQQDLFSRLYPRGVSKDQLCWAITQCHNTLEKNKAKEAVREI